MQTSRPPMAQNCQIIKAHSSNATGKAMIKPLAKPRWLGERADLAFKAIGCRFFISNSGIAGLLSNYFDLSIAYLCETFITIRSRRKGIFVSCNAAVPNFQGDFGAAAPTLFRPGTKQQLMQLIKQTIRCVSLPSALDYHSPRQSSRRDAPSPRQDRIRGSAAAKLGKLGDRK